MTNKQTTTYASVIAALRAHKASDTPDIVCVLKPTGKYAYTEQIHAFCVENDIDIMKMVSLPQKQVKRFTQFVGAIVHRDMRNFDYTHARILIALKLSGDKTITTSAIAALAANKITPNTDTRGITRSQVNTLFTFAHGLSTVKTKVSNSVGKNGFYQALGITQGEPGKQDRPITVNIEHPVVREFYKLLENTAESTLREIAEKNQ